MFRLGNFNIDEIIQGAAEDFSGNLLYTLDQLSSASIEISSESQDITDKNGNVVRTIYKSKQGTFNATNAFLHPQIMNAASGSDIEQASASHSVVMPRFQLLKAGATVTLDANIDDTTLKVIGIFGNGANSEALTKGTTASGSEYAYDDTTKKIEVPAAGDDAPVLYLVKYDRTVEDGIKLTNTADKFPKTISLTLYCSYVDPCDDTLKACYVVLPSFQPSPETTISLSSDEQEMDFNGNIQVDYCGGDKLLYAIYFPDEEAVKSGISGDDTPTI